MQGRAIETKASHAELKSFTWPGSLYYQYCMQELMYDLLTLELWYGQKTMQEDQSLGEGANLYRDIS